MSRLENFNRIQTAEAAREMMRKTRAGVLTQTDEAVHVQSNHTTQNVSKLLD